MSAMRTKPDQRPDEPVMEEMPLVTGPWPRAVPLDVRRQMAQRSKEQSSGHPFYGKWTLDDWMNYWASRAMTVDRASLETSPGPAEPSHRTEGGGA